MLSHGWESLTLLEAPGSIRSLGGLVIASPFVVGVEPKSGKSYYHYRLSTVEDNDSVTRTVVELPNPKSEKICELFRRLYSSERRPPLKFDCRAGLDFLIGASPDVSHTVKSYSVRGPMGPANLETGEPYMILADNSLHGFLATDSRTGLHIAGPSGGLGHTPVTDLMRAWEGTLQEVTGWVA